VAYNDAGERIEPGSFKSVSLIPYGSKDYFVPDIDPSNLIGDADSFTVLSAIDWTTDEAQIAAAEKAAQDKLKAAQKKAGVAGKSSGSTSSHVLK
jgi:hypothetical protein